MVYLSAVSTVHGVHGISPYARLPSQPKNGTTGLLSSLLLEGMVVAAAKLLGTHE